MPTRKGFTLIELLVSVAIVALLVGIVVASLRGVRSAAGRADSLGALRQIGAGHSLYTQDQNARLLPGYIDASLFAPGGDFALLQPRLPDGTVLSIPDRQSYVWRLSPYLDDAWQSFFADLTDRGALSRFQADFGEGRYGPAAGDSPNHPYKGNISERPAYGLNSIFVGGDSAHGGPEVVSLNPWTGSGELVATRLSQVRNPSSLIVFAPAAKALPGSDGPYDQPEAGFCELRPPFMLLDGPGPGARWKGAQWQVGEVGRVNTTTAGEYADGAGLPIDRRGGASIPVVHLDGSADVEEIATLSGDMRRWCPSEVAVRDIVP